MRIFLKLFFIILIFSILPLSFFAQKSLIIKIKPEYKHLCKSNAIEINSLQTLLKNYSYKIKQLFPNAYMPDSSYIFFPYCVDISTIYELAFVDIYLIDGLTKKISQLPEVLYCHEKDYPELLFTPNDPATGAQYYLYNVRAYEAWDIYKGDSTVVVGIVDTGVELAHDDLWANIAYNYSDPIDGVDNDADGYVDNFRGWDMGNNDNSPEWSENLLGANPHGVFVAGMAAPTTNNGIGIAGVGFKTRFLPIKIIDSMGVLSRSYEGIVYAADHGCKIVNCSWGSPVPTEFGYDVVRYATYNRGALIFAAAGNKGHTSNDIYYPAAYPEVVCVAATNQADIKWNKSCYGYHVDVAAPGENVYSTYSNNGYTFGWGTSYASPLAASVAALVHGYYQQKLNPFQLRAVLERTSDVVDTIAANVPYQNMMGKGRVNALNALSQNVGKAVQLFNFQLEENGDTSILSFSLVNLFNALQNVSISVTTQNPYLTVQNNLSFAQLDSLQIVNNQQTKFRFVLSPNCPFDDEVDFFIHVDADGYSDMFHYRSAINKSYADMTNGTILLTACSNGRVGYNTFSPVRGKGLVYSGTTSLIAEMGLFVLSKNKASFCLSGQRDFTTISKVSLSEDNDAVQSYSKYNETFPQNALGIEIEQYHVLYKADSIDDVVKISYRLINKNQVQLDSVYLGLYSDVDLYNSQKNVVRFDSLLRLMYVFAPSINGVHAGFLLSSHLPFRFYAIDNDGYAQSIKTDDGIDANELKQAVKQNRWSAGNIDGNDVSVLIAYGPIAIQSQDTAEFTFWMILGKNYQEIIRNTQTIKTLYDTTIHIASISESENVLFPNPTANMLYVAKPIENAVVKIFNQCGQLLDEKYYRMLVRISLDQYSAGLYWIQIVSPAYIRTEKVIKY